MENLAKVTQTWLEAVEQDEVSLTRLLSSKAIKKILEVDNHSDCASFLSTTFRGCQIDRETNPALTSSLFLLYVALCNKPELSPLRDVMIQLGNSTQLGIMAFVSHFTDVPLEDVTIEDVERAAAGVPACSPEAASGPTTPARLDEVCDSQSPLQTFFQTPLRKQQNKRRQIRCRVCAGGERMKQLQLQMEEAEEDRAGLLQELNQSKALTEELEKKLQREVVRNDNLIVNMAALESEVAERSNQVAALEGKIKEISQQCCALQDDLAHARICKEDVIQQLSQREKAHHEVTTQMEELLRRNADMENRLSGALQNNMELEEILKSQNETLRELRDECQFLREAQDNAKGTNSVGNSFHETETLADQLLVDARQEIVALKAENEQRVREWMEKYQSKVAIISDVESSLEKAKHSFEVSLSEVTEEKRQLGEALLAKSATVTQLEATVKETLQKYEQQLASVIAERDSLCEELAEINQQVVEKDWAFSKMDLEYNAKITDLEKTIDQISKQIEEVTAENSTLKNELDQSNYNSARHLQTISQMTNEVNNLNEKCSQTTVELHDRVDYIRNQACVIDLLGKSLSELIDEERSFNHSQSDITMVSTSLQEIIQKAFEEKNNLLSALARCQSELEKSKDEKAKSDRVLEECQTDAIVNQQLLASCEERISQLQLGLSDMEEVLKVVSKDNGELNAKLEECQHQLNEKVTEISRLTQEIVELKSVLERKKQLLSEKESVLCERETSLAILRDEVEKSRLELLRIKKERDEYFAEAEGIKEKSDITIASLKEQLKLLSEEKEEVSLRLEEVRTVLVQRDEEIAVHERENEQSLNILKEMKTNYDILREEKIQLTSDFEKSRHSLQSKLVMISENVEEIRTLKNSLEQLSVELKKKEALIVDSGEAVNHLKQELELSLEESKKIKICLEGQLLDTQSNCEKLKQELKEIQRKVTEKEQAIESLETELRTIKSDLKNERTNLMNLVEKTGLEKESFEKILLEKNDNLTASRVELDEVTRNKTQLEEKLCILMEENNNLSFEVDRIRNVVVDCGAESQTLRSELGETKRKLEEQAVEFNREKMQITAELELQQRNSATALRHLEAKNLALDEVKNVAMTRVHELLKSHGQLRQELEDLVANKSAENSMLDMQVKEARSKCQDLTTDLAYALSNVDTFKATVQHFKIQQDKMKRLIKEKEEAIQELKKECDYLTKTVSKQSTAVTRLLSAFGSESSAPITDGSDETDYSGTFEKLLSRFRSVIESRNARQEETSALVKNLRNELHVLQCERLRSQEFLDSLRACLGFWMSPAVKHLLERLEDVRSMKEVREECKAVLQQVGGVDAGNLEVTIDATKIEENMSKIQSGFLLLLKFAEELRGLLEAREKLQLKLGEDYKNLEQRTLSLAEINSRLSTEIHKLKDLSSLELSMREDELMSLKTTVSSLNEKIQKISNCNAELDTKNRQLADQLDSLKKIQGDVQSVCTQMRESDRLLLTVLTTKDRVDKTLNTLRSQVPEMLTVITTLEHRRDSASDDLLAAITENISTIDKVIDVLDLKTASTDLPPSHLTSILNTLTNILENADLIQTKRHIVEDLSDSLEEVPVQEKTFPIISLHDDTFSMPPQQPRPQTDLSCGSWVVSPPSKKRNIKALPVKAEKTVSGESWVIPIGPAPAKPARKTEPRTRTDSTSSTSSTKSLPSGVSSRSSSRSAPLPLRPSTDSHTAAMQATVIQAKREKEVLVRECHSLRARVHEVEEKREKERELYENAKTSTRQKYEKQLDHMKAEMKQLYNQEMLKHKLEQAKAAEELKKRNEDLWKQNVTYKEHIDDLRSQLWSLGDKLLQEQNRRKEPMESDDLSRQLDRMTLHPSGSWKSLAATNGEIGTSDGSGARSQQPAHFPPMPVEDEDEVFDNRCLEELKAGRPSSRDAAASQAPQSRLTELQVRNSLCPPHLKSSYPAETQFVSPGLFREMDLRASTLPFATSESQSLTDSSDPSMTRSLLPIEKSKKKEQTSYKRPGPPTPSKNGRPSLQGDVRLTPKRPLREQNQLDKSRGTPSRLKALFSSKGNKRESLGSHDENTAPTTPRGKGLRIFQRKPFGGRDF